jgi:endo-1,4-beta-xylanase
MYRRQFLQLCQSTGLFALAAVIFSSFDRANSLEIVDREIELKGWNFAGEPLAADQLKRLYFLDLNDEPLATLPQKIVAGKVITQPPLDKFAFALRLMVEGFGEVTLYADNEGKGYTAGDFPLNINLAFARSRLSRVREFINQHERLGFGFSTQTKKKLIEAKAYLDRAETTTEILELLDFCRQSLVASLWAGEEAVIAKAKQSISINGSRPDFLFGCNLFRYPDGGEQYNRRFTELFNYATLPFYWSNFEPTEGQPDFARIDNMVEWLASNKIKPKGHPLVYFHEAGIPNWIKDRSFSEIKATIVDRTTQIARHYQEKINYFDIINEANNLKWANDLKLSYEQFLEVTKAVSIASRQGNPNLQRIINHCCLWAENVPFETSPQMSPFQYLQGCLAAEVDFEIVGMQVYYPHQDMFEIDRLIERFSRLGKKIHITELGIASANTIDEQAMIKQPFGLWHQPWSETIQADWVEQFYTICYSKPYINAITWWDFADGGQFWPHGGLLRQDLQPKEAFYRLRKLKQEWS